jgi:acetylglutamate kinase
LLNQERAHAVGLSGKDAGLLRCRKGSQRDADGGIVGEITHVNHDLIEVLVTKQYVPVISPIGLGEDGGGYHLDADATAAEVAVAMQAAKLLYVTDEPGLVEAGELVSEIGAHALRERLRSGRVQPSMVGVFESCLRAIDGGVESVHVIDGRTPHSLIAELFTDRGVGTLILRD